MNLMSQILATEPGEISGSKWINVRPHPSPLPRGEGEIVAVCWRSEGTEFAPVQGFNARNVSGKSHPNHLPREEGEMLPAFWRIMLPAKCSAQIKENVKMPHPMAAHVCGGRTQNFSTCRVNVLAFKKLSFELSRASRHSWRMK